MSTRLVACASCGRHVLASETKCPFCERPVSRRLLASIATVGAGLSLLGCPKDTTKAAPEPDAQPSAAASASAAPSALDDGASGLAAGDLKLGHSDGPLLRGQSAVYGPARTMNADGGLANAGVRGECALGASSATVPSANADRVLAGMRPRFRASYNSGLQSDPSMAGTFTFTADVAADGSVTAVDVRASKGLSPAVMDRMTGIVKNAQFEAPGKPSRLTATVTCTTPK